MKEESRVILNAPTQAWLTRIAALGRPEYDDFATERERRLVESAQLSDGFVGALPGGITVREHRVGDGLLVREVRGQAADGPLPAYLLLHGGAFWHGSATESVNMVIAANRALQAGVAVFLADYRLAPEFPCPAAIDDTIEVLRWLQQAAGTLDLDPSRLLLGGISAGANIATAAAARVTGEGLIAGLILEVPAVDLRPDGSWDERFAAINGLDSTEDMTRLYAGGLPADHPDISPVLVDVTAFPATHIVTAEYDPLRGGGEILATRLREAGVRVTATRHLGALHGSLGLTGADPIAQAWQDDVSSALRRLVVATGA